MKETKISVCYYKYERCHVHFRITLGGKKKKCSPFEFCGFQTRTFCSRFGNNFKKLCTSVILPDLAFVYKNNVSQKMYPPFSLCSFQTFSFLFSFLTEIFDFIISPSPPKKKKPYDFINLALCSYTIALVFSQFFFHCVCLVYRVRVVDKTSGINEIENWICQKRMSLYFY